MGFELPPALLYGFGAVLMILGGLRAYHLGWKRKREEEAAATEVEAEGEGDLAEAGTEGASEPRRDPGWRRRDGGGYKRHIAWGMLWVGMGLFLIVSTLLKRG